jgi:hypothetical protein
MLLSMPRLTPARNVRLAAAAALVFSAGPATAQRFGAIYAKTNADVLEKNDDCVPGPEGGCGSSHGDRRSTALGLSYRHAVDGATVQVELIRVQRGWSAPSIPRLELSYAVLPILVRFGALRPGGGRVRPVFTAGMSLNYAMSCTLISTIAIEGPECNQQIVGSGTPRDFSVNRFDLGGMLGVGVEVRLPGGTILGLEGRYERGRTDIRDLPRRTARNQTMYVLWNLVPRFTK